MADLPKLYSIALTQEEVSLLAVFSKHAHNTFSGNLGAQIMETPLMAQYVAAHGEQANALGEKINRLSEVVAKDLGYTYCDNCHGYHAPDGGLLCSE